MGANVPFVMLPGAGDMAAVAAVRWLVSFSPYTVLLVLFVYIIHVSVSPRLKTPSIRRFRIGKYILGVFKVYNININARVCVYTVCHKIPTSVYIKK